MKLFNKEKPIDHWAPDDKYYVCPKCLIVTFTKKYCSFCGTLMELREGIKCPNGHSIPSLIYGKVINTHYCYKCGAKLDDSLVIDLDIRKCI